LSFSVQLLFSYIQQLVLSEEIPPYYCSQSSLERVSGHFPNLLSVEHLENAAGTPKLEDPDMKALCYSIGGIERNVSAFVIKNSLHARSNVSLILMVDAGLKIVSFQSLAAQQLKLLFRDTIGFRIYNFVIIKFLGQHCNEFCLIYKIQFGNFLAMIFWMDESEVGI
jgi:hypothetical protein